MGRAASKKSSKGAPFSIRLSAEVEGYVEAESKRVKRSRSSIVETLVEEAATMRRFPGIGFSGDDARRRPYILGTGLDVWELAMMHDDYESIVQLVNDTHVTERQVREMLAYRMAFPDEIEQAIRENKPSRDELRALLPSIAFGDEMPDETEQAAG
jgi:uncharacterized protein (DUF433 family)